MDQEQKKLTHLVAAQTTIENLARSRVARWSSRLAYDERKLELAKQVVSSSSSSLAFADIHIRHIQRLVESCSEVSNNLAAARAELQSEMVRSGKLKDRLRSGKMAATREIEGKAILERLDWTSLQR